MGLGAWLGPRVLALEQVFQRLLAEVLEVLGETAAVRHPRPHGLFQGVRDVQHRVAAVVADGQVQGAVALALLAAAGRLSAGAGPLHPGAAQAGRRGDPLGTSATCVPLWGRALRALTQGVSATVLP